MPCNIDPLVDLDCPTFNQAFINWLNTLKTNQESICESIGSLSRVDSTTLTQADTSWSGSSQVIFLDETYVRLQPLSQLLILVTFTSMIEANVGPPENDVALSNTFAASLGSEPFIDIGRNFNNSVISAGDTSDSGSEVTGIGAHLSHTGTGDIRIRLRRTPVISQGSNLRGDERGINVTIIEIGD